MKHKSLAKIMVAAAAMLMTFTLPGSAQCQERLTFEAPFAFRANGVDMPAGQYSTDPNYVSRTVLLRAIDGKPAVFVACGAGRTIKERDSVYGLTFTLIGKTYLLTSIWEGEREYKVNLPKADSKMLEARNVVPDKTFIIAHR